MSTRHKIVPFHHLREFLFIAALLCAAAVFLPRPLSVYLNLYESVGAQEAPDREPDKSAAKETDGDKSDEPADGRNEIKGADISVDTYREQRQADKDGVLSNAAVMDPTMCGHPALMTLLVELPEQCVTPFAWSSVVVTAAVTDTGLDILPRERQIQTPEGFVYPDFLMDGTEMPFDGMVAEVRGERSITIPVPLDVAPRDAKTVDLAGEFTLAFPKDLTERAIRELVGHKTELVVDETSIKVRLIRCQAREIQLEFIGDSSLLFYVEVTDGDDNPIDWSWDPSILPSPEEPEQEPDPKAEPNDERDGTKGAPPTPGTPDDKKKYGESGGGGTFQEAGEDDEDDAPAPDDGNGEPGDAAADVQTRYFYEDLPKDAKLHIRFAKGIVRQVCVFDLKKVKLP